jgi:hypothetical protein
MSPNPLHGFAHVVRATPARGRPTGSGRDRRPSVPKAAATGPRAARLSGTQRHCRARPHRHRLQPAAGWRRHQRPVLAAGDGAAAGPGPAPWPGPMAGPAGATSTRRASRRVNGEVGSLAGVSKAAAVGSNPRQRTRQTGEQLRGQGTARGSEPMGDGRAVTDQQRSPATALVGPRRANGSPHHPPARQATGPRPGRPGLLRLQRHHRPTVTAVPPHTPRVPHSSDSTRSSPSARQQHRHRA